MRIKCCVLNLEPMYDKRLYEECLLSLPEHGYWKVRKAKTYKYRFQGDRIRSLGAGILLYHMLKENGMENVDIDVNQYGKPFLCNNEIQFNLSHSGNYAVCSYGQGDSGIDIEWYKSADLEIARRFFEQQESRLVEEYGTQMFIRLWTLKESYIKAEGKGLKIPLDSFQICPGKYYGNNNSNQKPIAIVSNDSYVDSDIGYHFVEFKIEDFHISVCSKSKVDEEAVLLELFKLV